jgi:SAM-dependent methyltransferase
VVGFNPDQFGHRQENRQMSLYGVLRELYRTLVPGVVRRRPVLARLAGRMTGRFGAHDLLYTKEYFVGTVEEPAAQAAPGLAEVVNNEFRPTRVIDVGCGTGALLEALTKVGCTCVGLEYADAGLRMCRARNLDVRKFDLERDRWQDEEGTFDVAISTEVAEHLPERAADRYVSLLASLAPTIVFTAATVGQGGTDHVNEQPHDYWVAKFEARGYRFQPEITARWRRKLEQRHVAAWYSANLMIFHRPSCEAVKYSTGRD